MKQRNVGILIFEGVEVLDFCGPFEVFATTELSDSDPFDDATRPFRVFTIAEQAGVVKCTGGLLVQPHFTIEDHPPLDILVVPGGYGTRREVNNPRLLDWIAAQDRSTELTTSVCTGAFLLAARGLLDNMAATTHWASIERLRTAHPAVTVHDDVRYVDSGRIVTSAGVSAGIDMSLHVVARLLGEDVARHTARRMEYGGETRNVKRET
jgi:transcriptional regulator GlxA family with amidase domain